MKPAEFFGGLKFPTWTKWVPAAREGVIIECPLKQQFHNVVIVILMSRVAVIELVDNDNRWSLGKILTYTSVKVTPILQR